MRIVTVSLGVAFCAALLVLSGTDAQASADEKAPTTPVASPTVSGSVASTFQMPWVVGVFQ